MHPSDRRNLGLRVTLAALALVVYASPAAAQGTVRRSRLIATTVDRVPGAPPGTFFEAGRFQPAFSQPRLSGGFHVSFYGLTNAVEGVLAGVFSRGSGGLRNVAPLVSFSFPEDTSFSSWDVTGEIFADGDRLALQADRNDWSCDAQGSCSIATETGIWLSRDGGEPDLEVAGSRSFPVFLPNLLAYESSSLLYVYDDLYEDGAPIVSPANALMIDGFEVTVGGPGDFGYRKGTALAFLGFGSSQASSDAGIWGRIENVWTTVATTETVAPGFGPATFTRFGPPAVGFEDFSNNPPNSNVVVFRGEVDFDRQGIYRRGGSLSTVADTSDSVLVGGFSEELYGFGDGVAVDGLDIAFTANNERVVVVADGPTGVLESVLSSGDTIQFGRDEYTVVSLEAGPNSFSSGNIAVRGELAPVGDPNAVFDAVFIVDVDGTGIGGPGSSQDDPVAPDSMDSDPGSDPTANFDDAPSVNWIDPTAAPPGAGAGGGAGPPSSPPEELTYRMTDGALFTAILDLPTGFSGPFEVLVEGDSHGSFGPGDLVDFGAGVQSFTVRTTPPAEPGTDVSPALALEFDELYASFAVTTVPEPVQPLLAAAAVLAILLLARRRRGRASGGRRAEGMRLERLPRAGTPAVLCAALLASPSPAAGRGQVPLEPLVLSGDPAPGTGPGVVYESFPGPAIMNARGQVAFSADLEGGGVAFPNDRGTWLLTPQVGVAKVVAGGDPVPGAPSDPILASLNPMAQLNDSGEVALAIGIQQIGDSTLGPDGLGGLALVGAFGDPPPDGEVGESFSQFDEPHLDNSGVTTFDGRVSPSGNSGIYQYAPPGPLVRLYGVGDLAPGFDDVPFVGFDTRVSQGGVLAFVGGLDPAQPGITVANMQVIWSRMGASPLEQRWRAGDPAIGFGDPRITYDRAADFQVNDLGNLAVSAFVTGVGVSPLDDQVFYGPDAGGGLEIKLREGDPAPGIPNSQVQGDVTMFLNNRGEVAFEALVVFDGLWEYGLFGPNEEGALALRLLGEDPAPGFPQGALVKILRDTLFNDSGVMACSALVDHPQLGRIGVLYWTNRQGDVIPVAWEGQQIEVGPGDIRTVGSPPLMSALPSGPNLPNATPLNENGDLVIWLRFEDDSEGLFLAVPEPSSGALQLAALGALLALVRSRVRPERPAAQHWK